MTKEYGLIVSVDSSYTGFIVNEQRINKKDYKVGKEIQAIVLDVDYDKKIIDLSEKLVGQQKDQSSKNKAVVQLTKGDYMICTLQDKFGVCLV